MNQELFADVFNAQIHACEKILVRKADEYATDVDRLHNFKQAAHLQGGTPAQALAGFMAKHTVSIYDMIRSGKEYTPEKWDEKITDHINYLILLKAVVHEQAWGREDSYTPPLNYNNAASPERKS